jgi:hypothetical protein
LHSDNVRTLQRNPRLTAAFGSVGAVVGCMAKHLCSGAAIAPETHTAIVATRAILLRDCVFTSNVRASPDPRNQSVQKYAETNKTSESKQQCHPTWSHRWSRIFRHRSVWLDHSTDKHMHSEVENREDHHDLER